MKSLYAYFGLVDLHNIDSPGHSFYQIGLIDSIRETYGDEKFDFYSYYPKDIIERNSPGIKKYPDEGLGVIFNNVINSLFDNGQSLVLSLHFNIVLQNIREKKYKNLYLKARFRNLSTLRKKWLDALEFETIIETAISAGYTPEQINVLDTDLSLSKKFVKKYESRITILVPSIDFPGISTNVLNLCRGFHERSKFQKDGSTVFYGNLNTLKYKAGNAKSDMLISAILELEKILSAKKFKIICKQQDFDNYEFQKAQWIPRWNRFLIWEALTNSNIMINITKEKYNEEGFIPARVYEAMIFGMIPVSYGFEFLSKTFSFLDITQLKEIIYYLDECEPADFKTAYGVFIDEYLSYCKQG
jgi:hypothetical protein